VKLCFKYTFRLFRPIPTITQNDILAHQQKKRTNQHSRQKIKSIPKESHSRCRIPCATKVLTSLFIAHSKVRTYIVNKQKNTLAVRKKVRIGTIMWNTADGKRVYWAVVLFYGARRRRLLTDDGSVPGCQPEN
jgi:hypothetical protein